MYTIVLAIHSLTRWLVLASLVFAIFRAYRGWLTNATFAGFDNKVRHVTATIAHVQLVLGLWLYFISPLTTYFLNHYSDAVHNRELRFFGMEHITMMLLAITIITIGSVATKRKTGHRRKYRTMAVWYTIALLIIISSVPWSFSPVVSRPNFRGF